MSQAVVYLNGAYLPESEARISVFDLGFTSGDAVYEVTRTFGHRLFRLDAHIDRLFRSLRYARIDCGLDRDAMTAVSRETSDRNLGRLGDRDDHSLWHVVSRGSRVGGEGATLAIFCLPVGFDEFAREYVEGVTLVTPAIRRIPPQSLEAKAKIANKMNHKIAVFEARQADPRATPLMLDVDGNVSETDRANFFFVRDGALFTSTDRNVLGGITREAAIELAGGLGIEVKEGDFTPYDVYNAEEAFTTGTSATVAPVRALNGLRIGDDLPGPVTMRLIRAFNDLFGFDYVAQALDHLGDNERGALSSAWRERLADRT